MTRKTWDRLEFVVFIIFILVCLAFMLGVLFEQGCILLSEPRYKPTSTVLAKEKTVTKTQAHLTLYWADIKAERIKPLPAGKVIRKQPAW